MTNADDEDNSEVQRVSSMPSPEALAGLPFPQMGADILKLLLQAGPCPAITAATGAARMF